MRKFLRATALTAVVGMTLTACGGNATNDDPWNITTAAGQSEVNCDNVIDVRNELSQLANDSGDDAVDRLAEWGFAPADGMNVSSWDVQQTTEFKDVQSYLDKVENSEDCGGDGAALETQTASNESDSSSEEAGDDGTATVTENGKKRRIPLVKTADDNPSVDTRNDTDTPATTDACPTLIDWSTLVDCVEDNDLDWYIKGVNQRETKTGFDWDDITRWADAKNAATAEVRAIEVYGAGKDSISNAEARKRAAEMVGGDVAHMAIIRQPRCFSNTRGLEAGAMHDFVYCPPNSRQVRVTLLPAVMKGDKIVGVLDTDSGVFVDCINLWWIPEIIKVPGLPPQTEVPPEEPPVVIPPPDTPEGGGCEEGCGETPEEPPLKPKSSDPRDYVYPEGKPKVTVNGPAESTPSKVETSKPGGGGQVDSPTKAPGSTSGVTAPGADPAPSGPRDVNPPQGGSSGGGSGSGSGGDTGGGSNDSDGTVGPPP